MIRTIAEQMEVWVEEQFGALAALPENVMLPRPAPGKWSKKEILGHLIDSAQNNIRRFIVAQYENSPHIVYKQVEWVNLNAYQEAETKQLIQLWYLLNKQLCRILRVIPEKNYQNTCLTQESHSLEWLAEDYFKHLKHHLHVVLELEPVEYS
jgi:hypothetical protein